METLEEIGTDEMLEYLCSRCARPSRENFFQHLLVEEAHDFDAGTVLRMRRRLHDAYGHGPEDSLLQCLTRRLRDPIKPATESGAWRPHPLLLVWGGAALLALGNFVYWSFFR